MTNLGKWLGSILIVALSAMGGILGYLLWMAIAIPATRAGNDLLATALWILSPFLTALGFATGAIIAERKVRGVGNKVVQIDTGHGIFGSPVFWNQCLSKICQV